MSCVRRSLLGLPERLDRLAQQHDILGFVAIVHYDANVEAYLPAVK